MGRMEGPSRTPEELKATQDLHTLLKNKERDKENRLKFDICEELKTKAIIDDRCILGDAIEELAEKIRVLARKEFDGNNNEIELLLAKKLLQHVYQAPLLERSPMRVSYNAPYQEPYNTNHKRDYSWGSRVVEKDDIENVESFLTSLTQNQRVLMRKAVDELITGTTTTLFSNQPWQSHNQANDLESQRSSFNITEDWESRKTDAQISYRVPRNSFSSSCSTNSPYSESPNSSPDRSPYGNINSPGSSVDLNFENLIPATVADMKYTQLPDCSPPPPLLVEHPLRVQHSSLSPPVKTQLFTPAKDKLDQSIDPAVKKKAWVSISVPTVDDLGRGDSDGDTQLMILMARNMPDSRAYVYCIVERLLKENPNYLLVTNKQQKDALHIAAEDLNSDPIIAAYLAEALVRANLPVAKVYENGESLLHILARKGNGYAKVIRELLSVKKADNVAAFDVNALKKDGLTPLHIACQSRKSNMSTEVVQALLDADADPLLQEYINKNTPLHMLVEQSSDLLMINTLLNHLRRKGLLQQAMEMVNRQQNTVLHLACAKNSLQLNDHCRLVKAIVSHGGQIHLKNNNGQVPSYLVDPSRKREIKEILHAKK